MTGRYKIIAYGRDKDFRANYLSFSKEVNARVQEKYAKELEVAGFFRRIYINIKMSREVKREVHKRFSMDKLYISK